MVKLPGGDHRLSAGIITVQTALAAVTMPLVPHRWADRLASKPRTAADYSPRRNPSSARPTTTHPARWRR
ncbi:hypothetical protein ACS0Y7_06850 [Burkholderia gladioli]|uniref:hypothetical protein n=1 Tax=Burkholderia gladioli TaxID=28095 RepID=UPI001FC7C69D|nr:hypothetical protein [Burkholderia gladioli]